MEPEDLIRLVDAAGAEGLDVDDVLDICTHRGLELPLDIYVTPPEGGWSAEEVVTEVFPNIPDLDGEGCLSNEVRREAVHYNNPIKLRHATVRPWAGSFELIDVSVESPPGWRHEVALSPPIRVTLGLLDVPSAQWETWVQRRIAGQTSRRQELGTPPLASPFPLSRKDQREAERIAETLGMIGADAAWVAARTNAFRAARHDRPTLIVGDTGTGKEMIAEFIREVANLKPWIVVSGATLRGETAFSELFGHEKGAFTGAAASKTGAFQDANGGGLYIDEVGELPMDVQAGLLRALQEGMVRPIGSSREHPVKVKVVTATNRDLGEEIKGGAFREDLHQRLSGFTVLLPPLAARRDDIALLARSFLGVDQLAHEVERVLRAQPWKGNVRQLKNVMENAAIYADGESVCPEHVISALQQGGGEVVQPPPFGDEVVAALNRFGDWSTAAEVAEVLGEPQRRVHEALVRAADEGHVEKKGKTKGTKYRTVTLSSS